MIKKIAILLTVAILLNALILVFVWAHRVLVTGLNPFVALLWLLLSLLVAVPLAVLVVKRLSGYYKGKPRPGPATLFVLGFFIFLTGDFFDKLIFGSSALDIHLQDTRLIADTYIMIILALIFLTFSAVYYFYPGITGRVMNAPMGYIHFAITLIGACLLCWPVHYISPAGMPRRYIDYKDWTNKVQFAGLTAFKIKVIILLICAQLLFIVNLIYAGVKGEKYRPV